MVLVLFSIFIVGAEAFAAKSLYDDFSGIYIDNQKWLVRELVREVIAGNLVSKIGNASGTGEFRNNIRLQNPESITAIECELTVVGTNLDTGTEPISFAGIGGFFYNTHLLCWNWRILLQHEGLWRTHWGYFCRRLYRRSGQRSGGVLAGRRILE